MRIFYSETKIWQSYAFFPSNFCLWGKKLNINILDNLIVIRFWEFSYLGSCHTGVVVYLEGVCQSWLLVLPWQLSSLSSFNLGNWPNILLVFLKIQKIHFVICNDQNASLPAQSDILKLYIGLVNRTWKFIPYCQAQFQLASSVHFQMRTEISLPNQSDFNCVKGKVGLFHS